MGDGEGEKVNYKPTNLLLIPLILIRTDFSRVHENATEVAMKEIFEEVLFVEFLAD